MNKLTIKSIDDYISDDSYAFIDIREVSECINDGMIQGFKIVPFYSVLKAGEDFYPLDREFSHWGFNNLETFKKHFDASKTIVLICNSGNRTAALKKALDFLGYETIDIGGIIDYKGKHLVKPQIK